MGELPEALRAHIEEEMGKESTSIVNLNNETMGDAGAIFLAEKLRGNTTVQSLFLNDCGIGAVGARALAESLSGHNDSLKLLSVHGNGDIGDDGAQALAQMLKKNTTVEKLYLGWCRVGDRGARALGEALKENSALKLLNIYANSISDDGAEALAEGLRWNESLVQLDLEECELTDAGASSLLATLRESNFTLTELNLDEHDEIESYDGIIGSIKYLLEQNKRLNPASAEQRARCLLFCCLRLAPTAHESVVPSIGAVPVPVMQYAVEHAGQLHVAKRFGRNTVVAGQFSSANLNLQHAFAAQVQQNAQLQQQIPQLRQQIAKLHQHNSQPRITELDAAVGASLASHASTLSRGDDDDDDDDTGEPVDKRAKTA